MTRITNTDQVILLLHNQLQRMKKTDKKHARRPKADNQEIHKTPLNRVSSMSNEAGLSQGQIHRALISGILTEEFGTEVANDPAFQKLIDDVTKTISSDPEGEKILVQAMSQLTEKFK